MVQAFADSPWRSCDVIIVLLTFSSSCEWISTENGSWLKEASVHCMFVFCTFRGVPDSHFDSIRATRLLP